MKRNNNWLKTVPPEGKQRILEIMKDGGTKALRWSVRLSPSTGTAKNVDLIVRDPLAGNGIVSERPIMRDGKLCEAAV